MSLNPAMLVIRFLLELAALGCFGILGWRLFEAPWNWVFVVTFPVIAAVAWGTFAVAGDPSRSGEAPIEVPGVARLGLELAILGGGAVALWFSSFHSVSIGYAIVVIAYHVAAYDRFTWLLKH